MCYRCREHFEVVEDDITPLGYLCGACFHETAVALVGGAVN
jgi:hypothetical protein